MKARIIAMISNKTHLPYELTETQVHLWRFNLEKVPTSWQAEGRHYLSADENERAAKFKRGQADYINTRIFMRRLLAGYTGQAAQNLVFKTNAHGKPFLPNSDLRFNLSHSQQWAVLAVGLNCDLGIDVESLSDKRSILDIAQHYFHADEIDALSKITNADEQFDFFFRLWTLKESFLKALGTGIATGLDKVNFRMNSNQEISAQFSEELLLQNSEQWQFFQYELLDASVKNFCSIAVRSPQKIQIKWM